MLILLGLRGARNVTPRPALRTTAAIYAVAWVLYAKTPHPISLQSFLHFPFEPLASLAGLLQAASHSTSMDVLAASCRRAFHYSLPLSETGLRFPASPCCSSAATPFRHRLDTLSSSLFTPSGKNHRLIRGHLWARGQLGPAPSPQFDRRLRVDSALDIASLASHRGSGSVTLGRAVLTEAIRPLRPLSSSSLLFFGTSTAAFAQVSSLPRQPVRNLLFSPYGIISVASIALLAVARFRRAGDP